MRIITAIIVCSFIIFSSLYGQNKDLNEPYKKLEFRKGLPENILASYKNLMHNRTSFSEIALEEAEDILYIIQFYTQEGEIKFYRIRKNSVGDIIQFDFMLDTGVNSKAKIIELDEDESYDYLLVLIREENEIFYSIENRKRNFEMGFLISAGPQFGIEDQIRNKKYIGNKSIIGGVSEFQISSKYVLNTNNKIEVKCGLSMFSENWNASIGLFYHQRISSNFYISAGSNFNFWSSDQIEKVSLNNLLFSYIIPTTSLVYYLTKNTYVLGSCMLNVSEKFKFNKIKPTLGFVFGLGMNFLY